MPFFASPERAIVTFVILAVFLLVAFPVHEFAHALAAYRLGDGTARMFGRLTLDPVAHFDPFGGLLLAVTLVTSGGMSGFGWAKPTPYLPQNLRGGMRGEAIVAAAGPLSNLVLATAAAIPFRILQAASIDVPPIVTTILVTFIFINILLMVFNLVPIPPLDGSKVLYAVLPPQTAWQVKPFLDRYGFLILLAAIFLPIPPVNQSILSIVIDVIGFPIFRLLTGIGL
ncbi:MAG: site-2 protease family protein [Chloroflexi bacterium]|nr:site-2 protease family protein [Chloroflexota bacterium]